MSLKKYCFQTGFQNTSPVCHWLAKKDLVCCKLTSLVELFYAGLVGMIKQTDSCLDKATVFTFLGENVLVLSKF